VHPAISETHSYLRDELAYLLLQKYARAQKHIDNVQHELDRLIESVHHWHHHPPTDAP
jgi:hypothetical protein